MIKKRHYGCKLLGLFAHSSASIPLGLILFLLAFHTILPAQNSQTLHPTIQSLIQLRELPTDKKLVRSVNLHAIVWYCEKNSGTLIVNDSTSTLELVVKLGGEIPNPGDLLSLSGTASIMNLGDRIEISPVPLIDNDGLHGEIEASGTVTLSKGIHPIRLEWFNALGEPGLAIEYQGPSLPRIPIPDSVLQTNNKTAGVHFHSRSGRWWQLPIQLAPEQFGISGVTHNFDISVAEKNEFVAIVYTGNLLIDTPGEYTFHLVSDDGSKLYLGPPSLNLHVSSGNSEELPSPISLVPGQPYPYIFEYLHATIEGKVTSVTQKQSVTYLTLESGIGELLLELEHSEKISIEQLLNKHIRATGIASSNSSPDGMSIVAKLLVQSEMQIEILPKRNWQNEITQISEIERFSPELLDGTHIVKIRGVVINSIPGGYAVVVQDTARAIFIDFNLVRPGPIELGELLEITGTVQEGEFSPFINATEFNRLGAGILPRPLQATHDEFINGSLHSQYVELEGYVLALENQTLTLRTRAGTLNINLEKQPPHAWVNSVLRLRGCLRSFWDPISKEIVVGKIELNSAQIETLHPAPENPFNVPHKRASELLKFDPNASAFQRIRITGQLLHKNVKTLYMLDGDQGLRVTLAEETQLTPGDIIEVIGFPEFDSPSPRFAHSIARKLNSNPLPTPKQLHPKNLLDDVFDSTLVSIDAELIGIVVDNENWSLQLRSGSTVFSAPLNSSPKQEPEYRPGSILRLTGVYFGLGGNKTLGLSIDAFEILLTSTDDISVISTPTWWTIPRLLLLLTVLSVILSLTLLWIKTLKSQVATKTVELKTVLDERHRIEQEEALASERSRLAYDLHDELGAGLTEVGLLGSLVSTKSLPTEKREEHLSRLSDKVRQLVISLDEIVWAVNPQYDTLSSFVNYYTFYAENFLELANIRCRFNISEDLPEEPLTSRTRHSYFLCFKEALTNVVRHANASEVVIGISSENRTMKVTISDNGCGITPSIQNTSMNGLASIKERLNNLGGYCELNSAKNKGTTVNLILPLS